MVAAMDVMVGRLIEALRESGLYENSLVVFVSDNGAATMQAVLGFHSTFYHFREEVIGLWEERRQQYGKGVTSLNPSFHPTHSTTVLDSSWMVCFAFFLPICLFCRYSSSCLPPFSSPPISWHLILWPDAHCKCHWKQASLSAFSELVSLTNIQGSENVKASSPRWTGCPPSSLSLGSPPTCSTRCRNVNLLSDNWSVTMLTSSLCKFC